MALLSRLKTWVTGEVLTASALNAEFDNLVNGLTSNNIEDISATVAAMQAAVDPGETGSESQATNLTGEIQRLRNMLQEVIGKTYWYQTPATDLEALSTQLNPVGTILAYGAASAPSGYLVCDGTAVSRVTYSALYAVVGNAFGEGDGASTFHLPDFRGRVLRCVDGGSGRDTLDSASNRPAMNTGGNTGDNVGSVQIDYTRAPRISAFTTDNPGDHAHTVQANSGAGGGTGVLAQFTGGSASPLPVVNAGGSHTHTINGGGDSETIMKNAYVQYIIKT